MHTCAAGLAALFLQVKGCSFVSRTRRIGGTGEATAELWASVCACLLRLNSLRLLRNF